MSGPVIPSVQPSIAAPPSIPRPSGGDLHAVVSRLVQVVNTLTGNGNGDPQSRVPTVRELVSAGAVQTDASGNVAAVPTGITTAEFIANMQSVTIVSVLPALPNGEYPVGAFVVLTTNGKLYRNVSGAWTSSVDGADIIASSIVAGAIAAGAITTSALAAGAVTATKISVSTLSAIAANLGTITAGVLQSATGAAVFDLGAETLTIKDATPTTRVLLGALGGGLFGMKVFSASGALLFDTTGGQFYSDGSYVEALTHDNIVNGSTYSKVLAADISGGHVALGVSGSGKKLGDQKNNPCSLTVGFGGVRSAQALTASSSGVVAVNAHTANLGNAASSYNANSSAVSGLSVGASYYVYALDNYAGGSPSWYATTSAYSANANDNVYIAGFVTIPSGGTSGGGGTGSCVGVRMLLREGLRAQKARPWHWIECWDGQRRCKRRVRGFPKVYLQPCVWVETEHGAKLQCSTTTPFTVRDGSVVFAPALFGCMVLTDAGWERVVEVRDAGIQSVVRLHVGGVSYAAGLSGLHRIFSHNPLKP